MFRMGVEGFFSFISWKTPSPLPACMQLPEGVRPSYRDQWSVIQPYGSLYSPKENKSAPLPGAVYQLTHRVWLLPWSKHVRLTGPGLELFILLPQHLSQVLGRVAPHLLDFLKFV